MKGIKLGDFRWNITLATRQSVPAEGGGFIDQIGNQRNDVPAAIEPIAGTRFFKAHQVFNDATHEVTIRYEDAVEMFDIIIRYSVEPDGREVQEIFHVKEMIDMDGRKQFLKIQCTLEQRPIS